MHSGSSFGAWLKQRRKALDLTQSEFARRVGCATVTIHKIEADGLRPSRQMAEQLARALELDAAERECFAQAARSGTALDDRCREATLAPAHAPSSAIRSFHLAGHNLPLPSTPLIGRDLAVADAVAMLRQANVRLLTLTGPGGVGKTRLSLAVAATLHGDFTDGVRVVALAPLGDPALVIPAIAQTLGVRESSGQALALTLQTVLREQQLLLVLDNFEQVLAAAVQIADLLQSAPALKVLVTSRAPLHLGAEHEFAVPPLALPDSQPVDAAAVTDSAAGALFVARAQAIQRDFTVTPANATAIAAICRRLDGLPLALELAAARSKVLPPRELLQRLEQRLPLLTGGSRDLPARQQTIRATLDWSYALLTAPEQALLRQLAVFVGGCTLAAAEAVCCVGAVAVAVAASGAPPSNSVAVVDALGSLVDQSLLHDGPAMPAAHDAESRFTMLELVREYAAGRLLASGDGPALQRRHAEHYLAFAETAAREIAQGSSLLWFERLEAEKDNLRAALAWTREQQEATLAIRLGTALGEFWLHRGYLAEGRRWLEAAVAAAATDATVPPAAVALALLPLGRAVCLQGDYEQADAVWSHSLQLFRDLDDTVGIAAALSDCATAAWLLGDYRRARALREEQLIVERAHGNSTGLACALVGLGWCAHDQGDFELAFELLEESLALGRKQGDTSSIAGACDALTVAAYQLGDFPQAIRWSEECLALFRAQGQVEPIGNVLAHLGSIAGYQGNMQQASHLLDEAMAMHQVHGSTLGVALTLRFQGQVARQCGDLAQAQTAYQDSLRLQRAMRGRWEITACLEGLAGVADGQGRPERAARLWGAAAKQRDQMGAPLPPAHRPDYDAAVAHARAALGAAVFDAVWAAGRALPLEHVIAEALAPSV